MTTPALEIRGLSKSFSGVRVLESVELTVERGEIHGLIGPNGSGKSTLVKILAGFHTPDGEPWVGVGGRHMPRHFSLADMRSAGVGFVHQDLALIEDSSVAENIAFSAAGFSRRAFGRIGWARQHARCRELLQRVNLDVDPRTPVARLSAAERTLVAIARALGEFRHEALLVLDEPTAALPRREVSTLFDALRGLVADGTAIVYVSHRLPELIELTSRITVLRDGRVIARLRTAETDRHELARLMLAEAAEHPAADDEPSRKGPHRPGSGSAGVVVCFENVTADPLGPASFALSQGEILVLTGSVGSGAATCGRLLYGVDRPTGGSIELFGRARPRLSPQASKRLGVAYLPADRIRRSSFQDLTVAENLLTADLGSVSQGWHVRRSASRAHAQELLEQYSVQPAELDRTFRTLSGGNQQKALLAKWLRTEPRVLVVDEPTQGIDLATRLDIYARLREAADSGLAILWITSDFEEASAVADRLCVFNRGHIVGELEGASITTDRIARLSLAGAA